MEWLDISWCGQVTDRGVKRLAEGCPALEEVRVMLNQGASVTCRDTLFESGDKKNAIN